MTGEACKQREAESISKVWHKTLLNRINQVSGAETSSERVSSEDSEDEPDAALLSAELIHVSSSSVNEADVQVWLNIGRNEPGTVYSHRKRLYRPLAARMKKTTRKKMN